MLKNAKHINRFMLFFILQFIIVSELFGFVISYFGIETDRYSYQTFGFTMLMLPPIFLYFTLSGQKMKSVLHLLPLGLINSVLVVILALTFQPVLMLVSSISSLFFPNNTSDFVSTMLYVPLWALVFSLALLPALFEEMVFRGICLNINLNMRTSHKVLLSSFFFALLHFSPHQFLYAFVAGVYLALLTLITRSLLAPVLTHFLWNALNVWIVYTNGTSGAALTQASEPLVSEIIISAMFILAITLPLFLFAAYLLVINNLNKIVFGAYISRLRHVSELKNKFKPAYAAPENHETHNGTDDKSADEQEQKSEEPKLPVKSVITWEFWAVTAVYAVYLAFVYFL